MERMLHTGPLVLPWTLLILLCGWQLGVWVQERLSARKGLAPGPHGWRLALVALLAARLGFVPRYAHEYGAAPWSVIDIRAVRVIGRSRPDSGYFGTQRCTLLGRVSRS